MNAVPPSMTPGTPQSELRAAAPNTLTRKWTALQDTANIVATLAEIAPDRAESDFPAVIGQAVPWRRELAERGIDDMTAVMESGLSALLGIEARGADPRAAAQALWREFAEARSAILALSPAG